MLRRFRTAARFPCFAIPVETIARPNIKLIIPKRESAVKLDEWHTFCDWVKTLPYMADILSAQ